MDATWLPPMKSWWPRTPTWLGCVLPDSLEYITKGAQRSCTWLALRPDLAPTAVDGLQLTLIEYRYVSVLVKQDSGAYAYESRRKQIIRTTQGLNISPEGTTTNVPTEEPGDFAYELRDGSGDAAQYHQLERGGHGQCQPLARTQRRVADQAR